jgi:hypothetical protein
MIGAQAIVDRGNNNVSSDFSGSKSMISEGRVDFFNHAITSDGT